MNVKVFERGSAKWIRIVDGSDMQYTSDESAATIFSIHTLHDANVLFSDFRVFARSMRAVPIGSNAEPRDCKTVRTFLSEIKQGQKERDDDGP